jgi:DNA-binding winged helix-turn-helix (wHTH) protein/tetratricopeptide (TPR) repeat protein
MDRGTSHVYEFGEFRVDAVKRRLFRGDAAVPATVRALDLLIALIERRGEVVSKDELLRIVWPDCVVQEANLSQNVFVLRKLLGERPSDHQYILTVPGRGYSFVADVRDSRAAARKDAVPAAESVAAPARRTIRSIAVTPFRMLDGEGADEHLGIGLADAVVTRLSGVKQLVVRPIGAGMPLTDLARDPCVLGRTLGVDALVTGSIKRGADRLRVTVQLVSVAHEATLWAHQFDERLTDLFAVEDSISEQVTRALVLELTDAEQAVLARRHTTSTEAYQAYLKGRYFWNKRTSSGFRRAIELFEQAIAIDPRYALAYAGIADCRNLLSVYSAVAPRDGYPLGAVSAAKALQIDDGLAEARVALAYALLNYQWNFADAETEFQRALAILPNYATAHHLYADLLCASGRFREAVTEIRRAQELDPVSLIINTDYGWILVHARQYDMAIRQLHETLELDSTFWYAHWVLGLAFEQTRRYEEGIASFLRARELSEDNPYILGGLGRIYADARRPREARQTLDDLVRLAERRYVSPFIIATVHAALGDRDAAFGGLDLAYEECSHWLMYVDIAPVLDVLRGDARFAELSRRVKRRRESALRYAAIAS